VSQIHLEKMNTSGHLRRRSLCTGATRVGKGYGAGFI